MQTKSSYVLSERLKRMMPERQRSIVRSSEELMSIMPELDKSLEELPPLYGQEKEGKNAIIHAHYFLGDSDWYITEFDGIDLMFGYVILNGDLQMSELGYISLKDLLTVKNVELDFHWDKITLAEMKKKRGI